MQPNLSGVNLGHADLSEGKLYLANLGGVDLSGANLSSADLRGVLLDPDLEETDPALQKVETDVVASLATSAWESMQASYER